MKQRLLLTLILLLGAFASFAPVGAQATAGLRVIHAVGDAPAVDVYMNGQLVVTELVFGQSTPTFSVVVGETIVEIRAAGTDTVVISETVSLAEPFDSRLVLQGTLDAIETSLQDDILDPIDFGFARLNLVHAVPGADAVDLLRDDDIPLILSNVYGQTNGTINIAASFFDLFVVPEGGTEADALVEASGVDLQSGMLYTVLVAPKEDGIASFVLADPIRVSADQAPTRIVHAVPDAPSVDLYVNDALIATNIRPENATEHVGFPTGDHELALREAGSLPNSEPIFTAEFSIEATASTLAIVADEDGELSLVSFADDIVGLTPDVARLQVLNGRTDAAEIETEAGTVSAEAGSVGDVVDIEPGVYEVGGFDLPLYGGTLYSIIVYGEEEFILADTIISLTPDSTPFGEAVEVAAEATEAVATPEATEDVATSEPTEEAVAETSPTEAVATPEATEDVATAEPTEEAVAEASPTEAVATPEATEDVATPEPTEEAVAEASPTEAVATEDVATPEPTEEAVVVEATPAEATEAAATPVETEVAQAATDAPPSEVETVEVIPVTPQAPADVQPVQPTQAPVQPAVPAAVTDQITGIVSLNQGVNLHCREYPSSLARSLALIPNNTELVIDGVAGPRDETGEIGRTDAIPIDGLPDFSELPNPEFSVANLPAEFFEGLDLVDLWLNIDWVLQDGSVFGCWVNAFYIDITYRNRQVDNVISYLDLIDLEELGIVPYNVPGGPIEGTASSVTPPTPPPTDQIVATVNVNQGVNLQLRRTPGSAGESLSLVPGGAQLTVIEKTEVAVSGNVGEPTIPEWLFVEYDLPEGGAVRGWVSAEFVTLTQGGSIVNLEDVPFALEAQVGGTVDPNSGVVTDSGAPPPQQPQNQVVGELLIAVDQVLNLRDIPSSEGLVRISIPADATLTVVGRNGAGDWLNVVYNSPTGPLDGWVAAGFVAVSFQGQPYNIGQLPIVNNEPDTFSGQ